MANETNDKKKINDFSSDKKLDQKRKFGSNIVRASPKTLHHTTFKKKQCYV